MSDIYDEDELDEDIFEGDEDDMPVNNLEEEIQKPTPKEKKDEVKDKKTKSSTAKKAAISINPSELEDFLAETNRLATVLASISKDLESIEKTTNVVQKLESISNLDLSEFKKRFEGMVKDIDLNQHIKEVLAKEIKPIAEEYRESNQLLKALIFEFEKQHKPKKTSKLKTFVISVSVLLMMAAGGGAGWMYLDDGFAVEKPELQKTVNNKNLKNFYLKKGTEVIRIDGGKRILAPKDMEIKGTAKGVYCYFISGKHEYKVPLKNIVKY